MARAVVTELPRRGVLGVSRPSWLVGVRSGAAATFVFIALWASGHVRWEGSDAWLFEAVARHPFGDGHGFPGRHLVAGVAYRYGRILYPVAAWTLAGGRESLIRPALALVFLVCVALTAALAAELCVRAGRPAHAAYWVFATPFTLVWFGSGVLTSETVVLALVLAAFVADADGRGRRVRGCVAAAALARELAVVPLLALVLADVRRRGLRATARSWWWVPLPTLLWYWWVRVHVGTWPFTDPASSRRLATSLPFTGIVKGWSVTWGSNPHASVVLGIATLVLAAVVLGRTGVREPLALAALLSAAAIVCYGEYVWAFFGECCRVLLPTHVLLALLIVTRGAPLSRPRAAPASAR